MQLKIAVVEDDQTFLHHFKLWLADLFQTDDVHGFDNAEDAVKRALLAGTFDIVVLDIELLGRKYGGIDLAMALIQQRTQAQRSTPVVIMLSASIGANDVQMCEDVGADMVEPKPLRKSGLRDLLTKCEATRNRMPREPVKPSALENPNQVTISADLVEGANVFRTEKPNRKGRLGDVPRAILKRLLADAPEPVAFQDLYRSAGWGVPADQAMSRAFKSRLEYNISEIRAFLKHSIYEAEECERVPIRSRLANVHGIGFVWNNL